MFARREPNVAALLARVPVAVLGVAIASSALQASCDASSGGGTWEDAFDGADADASGVDATSIDSPSDDSPEDRADGMSYGDGYGPTDARTDGESDDGSCVSSTTTYPPAPGCPAGNHTWACWAPTPATGGIPASRYSVVTLCGDVAITDTNTHLMWTKNGEPGTYTWVAAAAACTASRRAGFSDWRLPSSNELMSLVDYANDMQIFNPVFAPSPPALWSSTPVATQAGDAWTLYASGGVYSQSVLDAEGVRCVR
jgi:hypothetical protein